MPRHWRWLVPYLFLIPGGLWLLAKLAPMHREVVTK